MVSGKRLGFSVQCLGFSVKCQVFRVTMLSTAARSTMVWFLFSFGDLLGLGLGLVLRLRV